MQFFGREDSIWSGGLGVEFGYFGGGAWFVGAHDLPSLDHVSFERLVCVRTIFSGVGVSEMALMATIQFGFTGTRIWHGGI